MLTKQSNFIILSFRIKSFRMPLAAIPIRCFHEIVEGFLDFLSLFRPISAKPFGLITMAQLFIYELQDYGSFDFIDVDVEDKENSVNIKFLMR
jgi:hypothetical protein